MMVLEEIRVGMAKSVCTHLDKLVPTSGNDDRVLRVRGEAHARDPLGVALVGDGVLAVTEGVPELDGPVTGAGDDLAVVGGEGYGEDIVGVANEAAGGVAGGELPKAEGLVPGRGEGVGTIGRDNLFMQSSAQSPADFLASQLLASPDITYAVGHNVGVAVQTPLGVSVRGLVASEVPDDQSLVAGRRQEHVRAAEKTISTLSSGNLCAAQTCGSL